MEPRLLDDPVVIEIARRVGRTPAQVLLAWAIQRGTALLTTATTRSRIEENFGLTALPDAFVTEISERITTRVQFNAVTESGIPGFIPRQG
jgi:diketogulonate reductase-like aldo/keto reductase